MKGTDMSDQQPRATMDCLHSTVEQQVPECAVRRLSFKPNQFYECSHLTAVSLNFPTSKSFPGLLKKKKKKLLDGVIDWLMANNTKFTFLPN